MTKKKVILLVVAALFAVSGLTALPIAYGGMLLPPHLVAGF